MKKSKSYQRVVLMLMLVIPAFMLVMVSPRSPSGAVDGATGSRAAQAAPLRLLPDASNSSQSNPGTGANLAGNTAPAADGSAINQAMTEELLAAAEGIPAGSVGSAGVPAAAPDVPSGEVDTSPPSEDNCSNCSDRPRKTRTPRVQQTVAPAPTIVPTDTPIALPTDTPVVLPTNTPVVLPTNTSVPSPTSPPPATWTPVSATATPLPNYHNPSPAVVAAEAEMFQLINQHRAAIGLNQWTRVTSLDLAERSWAVQMAVFNQCYHGDYGARAIAEGYTGWAWGEVGACGYTSAQDAFQGWLDSPGHRGIIEAGTSMDDIGIGAWQYPNGYFTFWALVGDSH